MVHRQVWSWCVDPWCKHPLFALGVVKAPSEYPTVAQLQLHVELLIDLYEAATYRYLRTITLDGDMSQMFVVPPE